jgi:hypothetical protein
MRLLKTQQKKRSWRFLFISLALLAAVTYLIYSVPPTMQFLVFSFRISVLYIFFPLLFLCVFCFSAFLFRSEKHALLIAAFALLSLLLLSNDLNHPFFFILLAALFLVIELIFIYNK